MKNQLIELIFHTTHLYQYGNSIYNIKVKNLNNKNTGVEKFILNGNEIEDKKIRLQDDGKVYDIEIMM